MKVEAGALTVGGPVTQPTGATLSGGTWIVGTGADGNSATLALSKTAGGVLDITTLRANAEVGWRGSGSTFDWINTLTNNQGGFHLLGGRDFFVCGTSAFINAAHSKSAQDRSSRSCAGRPTLRAARSSTPV